ncbi:hypothetical protein D3C86_1853250 [compost metagenome]
MLDGGDPRGGRGVALQKRREFLLEIFDRADVVFHQIITGDERRLQQNRLAGELARD